MRTGAGAGREGYVHEAAFYGSDEELLELAVPFAREGTAAGEPVVVALPEHEIGLVRRELGDVAGVSYAADQYAAPRATISSYRRLLADAMAAGAGQIRVVGGVPHPGTGAAWSPWRRYESVINRLYDEFPLWGVCAYDTRVTPDEVLDDVARTHPFVCTHGDHHANDRYEPPERFLAALAGAPPSAIERTEPYERLVDPAPSLARRAAARAASAARLGATETESLVLAVSELCTNALRHGVPPVVLRLWAGPGQVVATVTDSGEGWADPLLGWVPPGRPDPRGGLGLWLIGQVGLDVATRRDRDGFTVRVAAGSLDLL